jgi:hypothetical protein
MRPTIERAYRRGRFRGRRSLHQQGREIATRVTKSGAGVDADRDKAEDREQSGSWEKGSSSRGKTTMDLYTTLEPLPARLRSVQAATG